MDVIQERESEERNSKMGGRRGGGKIGDSVQRKINKQEIHVEDNQEAEDENIDKEIKDGKTGGRSNRIGDERFK